MNNINISFTEIERDFLVQVVKLFEATSEIKVSELKNKIIANEKSFSEMKSSCCICLSAI